MAEEDALRARWLDMVRRELLEAAVARPNWPIRLDHCFARVILDAVCGQPWREVVRAPAYKHLSAAQLSQAIRLAEAILAGEADVADLNRRSLQARGKLRSGL